ncbi:S-layer homology domain-containing protein [Deinococcus aquaticus]|uniref:S-layer homology domain-containing protein n=1 Tax=Deinococcus aquaticus TaxID=328692 RepID=A0ABY7V3I6_9DEIO|nr:S-layer homology domain-containing protein [Deinococcus aquaticus]WDA59285.1 S-layer homology domain-containing protein [Deinococcus aquaticus]
MKKSLLVLTAALSFGVAAAQTAAPASAPQVPALTDVPAGHWAKDAIDKLVSTGIILGYPDGTFRGTQNLTRYEAAVIIARLLDQVKSGEVNPSTMDPETLTALQNAIQELAADLAALGVRVSDLEENAVSRDDFARLEERVEAIALQNGDPEALAGLTSQIDELTARADDYDTLRADVDDNASSIAALNDLTVLLNQDILNLQDRVSAVEAAQADLVARADYDNLAGRVGVVETKVTSIDNRVTQLEKYAFSIKPSLSATYNVARADRNMDLDRLIPGTVFSTGTDDNTDTTDTAVDWADLTGSDVKVVNDKANFYGFSGAGNTPTNAVSREGATSISFSIDFNNGGGKIDTSKSAVRGAYVPGPGGLNVNSVDVTFGITAGLPSSDYISAGSYANYPDVVDTDSGITYRPLFFYFKNATAKFTVGNAPITVTFGKSLKFKFADYIGDNDKTARGDGYIVNVDGSTLPVIGAFKPMITGVYGSKGGANSDYQYYRGIRAEITPVGTLKAGLNYMQEGLDQTGYKVTAGLAAAPAPVGGNSITTVADVTAYGADLHGQVAGWQLDSEYAQSRRNTSTFAAGTGSVTPTIDTQNAFYAKTSGTLGPVKVYTLNYRSVSAGYDKVSGVMEANPKDTDNGSTAPYSANQTGFGVKVGTTLGPVSLAGYQDNKVAYGKNPLDTAREPSGVVDRGITAKVNLLNLITVRGGYYEYMANPLGLAGVRYGVRGDVTPGLGFSVGAYYRDLTINGTKKQNDLLADDSSLFAKGKYNSYFALANNDLLDQSGCADLHPGISDRDTDGVGTALTFSQNSFTDKKCYSEYGVEIAHSGKDANALVKNLDLRLGYAGRYREATKSYSNTFTYGDAVYSTKLGIADVNVKAAFSNDSYDLTKENATTFNSTAVAAGLGVKTDALNVAFKPSFEGQIGYYSRSHDYNGTASDYDSNAVRYLAGVKLNEFLLPNTKLAVYYAGYQGKNRGYTPFTGSIDAGTDVAGYFSDANNGGQTVSQDLLYVEGNYYDLSFGYGVGNLRLKEANGAAVTGVNDARGQVFKISYKVSF